MKEYKEPIVEIVTFSAEDIIVTSFGLTTGKDIETEESNNLLGVNSTMRFD